MEKDTPLQIKSQSSQQIKFKETGTFYIKLDRNQQQVSQSTVASQYFDQYQKSAKLHNSQSQQIQKLYLKISQNGFIVSSEFSQEIKISNINRSRSSQIVQFQVHLSYFKTKIIILNQFIEAETHQSLSPQCNGSFGQVYLVDAFGQRFAIKCLHFDYTIQKFYAILKQYFFLLLFSALQVGPKVKKLYGFDLLISQNCIQFSTQICENRINDINQKQLKQQLLKIHRLKIVHRDIKPQNIMYSSTFKKYVFIDFGGCDIVQQQVGKKSKSNFIGTLGFCYEQMASLVSKQQKLIDLYYNDVFGLIASLKQIRGRQTFYPFYQYSIEENQFSQFNYQSLNFLIIKFKLLLWKQQYQQLALFTKQIRKYEQNIDNFFKSILIFFFQLIPNFQHRNFFQKIFNQEFLVDLNLASIYKFYGKRHSYYFLDSFQNQQFRSIIKFYSLLEIQSKQIINQNYYEVCKMKINMQKIQLKNILNKQLINSKLNLETYFLLLLDFITFTQNQYNNSIQEKLQVCQHYLKNTDNIFEKVIINQPLICERLKIIAQTLKSLLLNFSRVINCFDVKLQFYWKAIKNYSLLCEKVDKDIVQSYNFKQASQFSLKQKIILFWRSYYEYQTTFFLQRYPNNEKQHSAFLSTSIFGLDISNKQNASYSSEQYQIHERQLHKIHNYLLQVLALDSIPFDQTTYDRIEQIILQQVFFLNLNFSKNEYKQFKKYIIYLTTLMCSYKGLQNSDKIINFMEHLLKQKILQLNYNKCLPTFKKQLLIYYSNYQDFQKLNQLFQLFDNVINCQQVSMNFDFEFRLLSAFHLNDYETINKISKIIKNLNTQRSSDIYKLFRTQLVFYGIQFYCQKQVQYKNTIASYKNILKIILKKGALLIKQLSQNQNKLILAAPTFQNAQIYTSIIMFVYKFSKKHKKDLTITDQLNDFYEYYQIDKIFLIVKKFCQNYLTLPVIVSIYTKLLDVYYKNNVELCLDQFESLYKKNQIQNKLKQNRLSRYDIQVCYKKLFYQLKLNQWKTKQIYQKFLSFYENIKKYVQFSIFFKIKSFFPILWQSFNFCKSSIQKRLQFLKQILQYVEISNSYIFTNFYHKQMNRALYCQNHKTCKKNKVCTLLSIIQLFHKHLQLYQNPKNRRFYSVISFYCLYNQHLSQKIKKRLLKSIKQNIKYLNQPLKRIILQKIYQFLHKTNKKKKKWMIKKQLKYSQDNKVKQEKIIIIEKRLKKSGKISLTQFKIYSKKIRNLCFLNII